MYTILSMPLSSVSIIMINHFALCWDAKLQSVTYMSGISVISLEHLHCLGVGQRRVTLTEASELLSEQFRQVAVKCRIFWVGSG